MLCYDVRQLHFMCKYLLNFITLCGCEQPPFELSQPKTEFLCKKKWVKEDCSTVQQITKITDNSNKYNWQPVMVTESAKHSCIQQMIIFCVSNEHNHMRTNTCAHVPYVSNTHSQIQSECKLYDLLPAREEEKNIFFVSFNCFITHIFVVEQICIQYTRSFVRIFIMIHL